MEIKRKVTEESFYIDYIKAFNGFLNLSNREILVLAELIKEDANLSNSNKYLLFETSIRKKIRERLDISMYSINNYIAALKKKGIIKEQDGVKELNRKIVPVKEKGKYSLTYNFFIHAK